jgi:hypothetical protein
LRHYVNVQQTDWTDHLVNVEIRMNNARNATTGVSPTELVFGSSLRLVPTQRLTSTTVPAVSEFLERIYESTQVAKDSHIVAKTRQAIQSNKDRREEPQYTIGDKVYLDTRNIRLKVKQKGRSTKFYPRFVGPFPITHVNRETSTYTLDLPSEFRIHPRFHAKLIKPAHENDPALFPDREVTVPPPIDAEDNQWEVQELLDHRTVRNKRHFLIRWVGWPKFADSWESERNVNPELVKAYLDKVSDEAATNATPSRNPREKGGVQGRNTRLVRQSSR